MALEPLATVADLDDRGIVVPDSMNAEAILASASDAVRDAAGCSITLGTSTVVLIVDDRFSIDLPAGPVASVDSVTVGGVPVVGWSKLGDQVVMPRTRWTSTFPVEVTVTYTHGYPIVPSDIVDMVCALAGMAFAQEGGYGQIGVLQSVRLGEYAETYKTGADGASVSPVSIPEEQRCRLRARFGNSVAVIGSRR